MKNALLVLLVAVMLGAPAIARTAEETSPSPEVLTHDFLHHHPDLKHRIAGMQAYEAGDFEAAFTEFRKAARWADKASQAMVAEMLWTGRGTAVDQAAAYAWIDLAAERGYKNFVARREAYWNKLDQATREQALVLGEQVYAEFGDVQAKPRLERKLELGRRAAVGGRVGTVGFAKIMVPGPGGWSEIDAATYYKDSYWRPAEYFAWQDRVWRDPPTGTVEIGPLASEELEPTSAEH